MTIGQRGRREQEKDPRGKHNQRKQASPWRPLAPCPSCATESKCPRSRPRALACPIPASQPARSDARAHPGFGSRILGASGPRPPRQEFRNVRKQSAILPPPGRNRTPRPSAGRRQHNASRTITPSMEQVAVDGAEGASRQGTQQPRPRSCRWEPVLPQRPTGPRAGLAGSGRQTGSCLDKGTLGMTTASPWHAPQAAQAWGIRADWDGPANLRGVPLAPSSGPAARR
ncbi:hypothetical protein DFJ74DRAFT_74188 [Hyaloraphidium curvatum]|nr:hypothetical protein DFJ74DRAFT_74188 [Hyaloraphidium curvatum]